MCSEQGETWGLAVNEAMNFSLPIIISDMVGCSDDLVTPGLNGWTYKCGDIAGLTKSLEECLSLEKEKLQEMGKTSRLMIDNYSFEVIANQLKKIGSTNSSK
jgi:glycosyltransferase involved in cell wall biosynthesis